jgi:ribosomal protein S18 acetylase RimI-like enzyme
MSVLIRPFAEADIAAAITLWRATTGVGLSAADEPAAIARYLARNPGLSWVAEAQGQLVGTLLCGHDGRRGLIHHLVAAGGHRRQRIGTRLVRAGLQGLRVQGIDKCHLMVFDTNTLAQAFWLALGAQRRGDLQLFSLNTDAGAGPAP